MSKQKNPPFQNKYSDTIYVTELNGSDFKINGPIDVKVTKPSFQNKFGLIKFYAPWCGFCKNMVEDLKFLGKGLKNHNFMIGAVNLDNPTNKGVADAMGVRGIPVIFNMNSNGELKKMDKETREVSGLLSNICEFTNNSTCCIRDQNGNIKC